MQTVSELVEHKNLVLSVYHDEVRPRVAGILTEEELATLDRRIWDHDSDKFLLIARKDEVSYNKHDVMQKHHYPHWVSHGLTSVDFIEHLCDHAAVNIRNNESYLCIYDWFANFRVSCECVTHASCEANEIVKEKYLSLVHSPRYNKIIRDLSKAKVESSLLKYRPFTVPNSGRTDSCFSMSDFHDCAVPTEATLDFLKEYSLGYDYQGTVVMEDLGLYTDVFTSEIGDKSIPWAGMFSYQCTEGGTRLTLWFAASEQSIYNQVIVHEASHLIDYAFSTTGMRPDDTENRAYRLGSLVKMITDCLSAQQTIIF